MVASGSQSTIAPVACADTSRRGPACELFLFSMLLSVTSNQWIECSRLSCCSQRLCNSIRRGCSQARLHRHRIGHPQRTARIAVHRLPQPSLYQDRLCHPDKHLPATARTGCGFPVRSVIVQHPSGLLPVGTDLSRDRQTLGKEVDQAAAASRLSIACSRIYTSRSAAPASAKEHLR